jgi:hypothetical protein
MNISAMAPPTSNLFMLFALLEGWRQVSVTEHRAARDYAQLLKSLSDTSFPKARKIILVRDNLSTHKPASLYEAFPPAEARCLVEGIVKLTDTTMIFRNIISRRLCLSVINHTEGQRRLTKEVTKNCCGVG